MPSRRTSVTTPATSLRSTNAFMPSCKRWRRCAEKTGDGNDQEDLNELEHAVFNISAGLTNLTNSQDDGSVVG